MMGPQVSVTPKGSSAQAPTNPLLNFMPFIVILGILYFLVIRPQQKQAADHRKMIDELKTGDKVLTQGGIFATVSAINGDVIQVKIADNVRINVARSAITQVIIDAPAAIPGATAS